ncbi:head-tail adaptor protein [Thioclava sp. GXIMD4215]|uniref:head-tail adaptor protein n=1 Tax=Thioclava sp. GXIMD4215 TaxID=3131928 RepID=UPI00324BB50C
MSVPKLSTCLVLEEPQNVPDGAGGLIETWVELGELWAALDFGTGTERADQLRAIAAVSVTVTVRSALRSSPRRPTANQRFRLGDRVFRILAVAEDAPGYLRCFAREEVVT